MTRNKTQILDTTLRDGEQTSGVSFSSGEKVRIAQYLLENVGVDRVEIGSSKTTQDDLLAMREISFWARDYGFEDRIEILTYTDIRESIDWIETAECKTVNILAKGSRSHCEKQLLVSSEKHFGDLADTIEYAMENGKNANVFLEDWSRGHVEDIDYVFEAIENICRLSPGKIYLCDTLGTLCPASTGRYVTELINAFPDAHFELHCHNDYGMAVANSLSGVQAGAKGVHATINGLGERAGNTPLEEIVVVLNDFSAFSTDVDEGCLVNVSNMLSHITGMKISCNKPVTGKNVFTHTSGIHVDGQEKGALYSSKLTPQRFQREWEYTLGKMSGKSNINIYLSKANMQIDERVKSLLLRTVKESGLGNKKFTEQEFISLVEQARKKEV